MSDEELVSSIVGADNYSVDLITVATALHWFDLPRFYSIVNRVLRKPGGIIAVWSYATMSVSPEFDPILKSFLDSTQPYWHPNLKLILDEYKALPFPFQSVGLGSESETIQVDIPKEISFDGFLRWVKSWSITNIDLLPEKLVKEFEVAWGGPNLIRCVVFKAFMLVDKVFPQPAVVRLIFRSFVSALSGRELATAFAQFVRGGDRIPDLLLKRYGAKPPYQL
ncbi:hypothetical protein FXO37_28114 [Capsicum annuum]|nr:hypothetical protein FXO37_28114 [Capsicum annuum]